MYQSKEDMVKKLSNEINLSLNESYKLMQEARRISPTAVSLLTIREKDSNTLRIAIDDETRVSQRKGNLYLIVILLMTLESVHILHSPYFFGLSNIGTSMNLNSP